MGKCSFYGLPGSLLVLRHKELNRIHQGACLLGPGEVGSWPGDHRFMSGKPGRRSLWGVAIFWFLNFLF